MIIVALLVLALVGVLGLVLHRVFVVVLERRGVPVSTVPEDVPEPV